KTIRRRKAEDAPVPLGDNDLLTMADQDTLDREVADLEMQKGSRKESSAGGLADTALEGKKTKQADELTQKKRKQAGLIAGESHDEIRPGKRRKRIESGESEGGENGVKNVEVTRKQRFILF